jgi:hypothetical protein
MALSVVNRELPWDPVTKAVGQAMSRHLPDIEATEAYYYLVMRHLAEILWQLSSGHRAVQALEAVLQTTAAELRPLVIDAPVATRLDR